MNRKEEELLREFTEGDLSREEFLRAFPVNIAVDDQYVTHEVEAAIKDGREAKLDAALSLIYLTGKKERHVGQLERLLVTPGHRNHQEIAWQLQALKSPSSVDAVRQVFHSRFGYLAYTRSEPGVIAKWLGGVLAAIASEEAIALLKEYGGSPDPEIAEQMQARLKALGK